PMRPTASSLAVISSLSKVTAGRPRSRHVDLEGSWQHLERRGRRRAGLTVGRDGQRALRPNLEARASLAQDRRAHRIHTALQANQARDVTPPWARQHDDEVEQAVVDLRALLGEHAASIVAAVRD